MQDAGGPGVGLLLNARVVPHSLLHQDLAGCAEGEHIDPAAVQLAVREADTVDPQDYGGAGAA